MTSKKISVVMIGATGAVGSEVAMSLAASNAIEKLTLLGRSPVLEPVADWVEQHTIDILDSTSYEKYLDDHDVAICTLGVGQPSSVTREEFLRIDKTVVVDFARVCRDRGVRHFQLLSSLASNPRSRSFYLRSKGQLEAELCTLEFERLSLFHPSMIITPSNRYGLLQAISLKVWPIIDPLFVGRMRKLRGIPSRSLGRVIAYNSMAPGVGREILEWDEFMQLLNRAESEI